MTRPGHPSAAEPDAGRATCWRCHKPTSLCLCARTPRVSNRTGVVVLRHRRERGHAVGTARIARLGLSVVSVHDVVAATRRPAELGARAALLSPGAGARDLATLPPDEHPTQLVVLDGTWRHAKSLLRENAWLHELPRVCLHPEQPSRYGIRRQPAPECLSTIESIVMALQLIEPDTPGFEGLLETLDTLVAEQRAFMESPEQEPRHQTRRPRPSRALPEALRVGAERLVLIYGETAPGRDARRRLVRLSALRATSGECFDAVLRPQGDLPAPGHLAHMGLGPGDLESGLSAAELLGAWRRFLRDDDLLAAWHPWARHMLALVDPAPPLVHALKPLWCNVHQQRCGGLEELAAREELVPEACALPGRAATRLGLAAAVARHLLDVAPRMAHATD